MSTRHRTHLVAMLVATGAALALGGVGAGCSSGSQMSAIVDAGPPGTCPMNPDDLISDFMMDNSVVAVNGRSGGWYLYPTMDPTTGDPNGMFDPPLPMGKDPYPIDTTMGNPYCSGPGSFHTKATNFGVFGAALATDFVPRMSDTVKGSYDASMYAGISFWARGAKAIKHVQIQFPDIYTDAEGMAAPDACVLATGFPNNCSPYLVKLGEDADMTKYMPVKIGTSWKQIKIYFADTIQDQYNPGAMSPGNKLDLKHLLGMAIQVNKNYDVTPPTPNDFEIWIDDVEFFR